MLTKEEFEQWCCERGLSTQQRQEIERIRCAEPSRLVGGGFKNVSGRYPSQKMGRIIQFESHKVELPFIYQLEHSKEVIEFYDQPPPFKINYISSNGRNVGVIITPDFFVISTNDVGWVECKAEKELEKLALKSPARYVLGEENQWVTPPAVAYAQKFGFKFQLWSSNKINWTLQRNLEFLEDYYKIEDLGTKTLLTDDVITSLVKKQPGITLAFLLDLKGVSAESIYTLIAAEKIYIDLSIHPLVESEKCLVFPDQIFADSYHAINHTHAASTVLVSSMIEMKPGTQLVYDGTNLTIALIGDDYLLLKTEQSQAIELKITSFEALVHEGKIQALSTQSPEKFYAQAIEIYQQASVKDLIKANERLKIIQPYLLGKSIAAGIQRERTIRNWLRDYKQAQQKYGYGYIGLLYIDGKKGNRKRKLPNYILDKIEKFITDEYENNKQKSKQSVYAAFVNSCINSGVNFDQVPSYKTFITEISKHSNYDMIKKRSGRRAAYEIEPGYWELELTTPRHGDFPFHIAHIDHTELDIELRCSKTGQVLGKCWLTLLVDAFSRRILAVYISYDPPSYRSCMMVLRICVQRHSRLPQIIVTDNGKEFYITYFETLLALFECILKRRPAAKPRFGGVCERLFGTTNTQLIYNLAGNTQITKKVRLVTSSVNPKNLSLWTLGLLYSYLCEWAYQIYDTTPHPALEGLCPQSAFTNGINQYGNRNSRLILYDENFRILTLPTTAKGKALVQPGKGIKVEHKYYWNNAFRDPKVEKTLVDVRYDPFNAGITYAYVQGIWIECISEYYALFRGRSEKEIQLATAQIKKHIKNHASSYKLNSKHLAKFIASAEAEEALLAQRLKDKQSLEVRTFIEGNLPKFNLDDESLSTEKSEIDSFQQDNPTKLDSNESINQSKLQLFNKY